MTFCRFGVLLHTAGFPRHKNNAAAGEDVATIPALRKGEMSTLHNCTEDTKCLPQHRDKISIAYLSRGNKYAFQRVQG